MASKLSGPDARALKATIIALLGTRCVNCGRETNLYGGPMDGATFQLGHWRSQANGAGWRTHEVVPQCRRCNVFQGDADMSDLGMPMLFAPLPEGTPKVSDSVVMTVLPQKINFEAVPWE